MWKPTYGFTDVLMHSRGPWKRHKYIAIRDGEYVYPESMGYRVRKAHTQREEARLAERDRQIRQAGANAHTAQRQGMRRTFAEKDAERQRAIAAREREALNARNLEAARKRAARLAGERATALNNARSAAQRQGMKRTFAEKDAARQNKQARYASAKSAAASAQMKGFKDTIREKVKQRNKKFRDQRNAEGRMAVRTQLKRAESRNRNEAARQKKLSAVNTTRAAQIRGMNRTGQINDLARAKRLRDQRNAEGRLAVRKQIAAGNYAARLRDQRNAEGRLAARKQIAAANQKRIAYSVRDQGRHINADMANGASDTRRTTAYRRSLDAKRRIKYVKSIKNPTARRNQARAAIEDMIYKNVKHPVKKAAKSAASETNKIYKKAKAAVKGLPSKVVDYLPGTVTVTTTDTKTGKTTVHSVKKKGWGSSKKKKKK